MGNRRYTQMALDNAFQELRRYDWGFGVLFIDIDHFKRVNDTHGHLVGDQILVMVASALRSGLRSFDFVGRWGGEEFIVLLPNITDDVLKRVAERCQQLVRESTFHHDGKPIQVTVSMGGVLADHEETAEHCVERADRLMYQSKAAGRDRITLA
jgi:diguanylate cyclase (GGDEF)-like protein